jgi:hypothetical protein
MGLKTNRTSFSRGNRSGHYTKNDKNMKIWNWSKWKTRITLKRRGELICLGSSRAVSCKSGKNPQNILFPAKKVIYFQLQTNPVISRFTWSLQKFDACQMWMRNIVVNLERNSNHHLNANVYVFITHAYVLIFGFWKKKY